MRYGFVVLLGLSVLMALSGCTSDTEPAASPSLTAAAASEPAPAASVSLPPAPAATVPEPIKTTEPDPVPAPAMQTAAPEPSETAQTAAPEPAKTPKAEPVPAAGDGGVTVAEGFYYVELDDDIKKRITGISYPEDDSDIAISYDDLRYLRVRYYDFDGNEHKDGELIVNRELAKDVLRIFYELYQAQYPLTSVRLVDDFGQPGDDTRSMEANNTSAFCYRRVTGSKTLSRHSLGAAIDINPVLNPYIDGDRIAPENAAEYADRSLNLPGMIDHDDLCYKVFRKYGWSWGGDWSGDKDYQHFSKSV